MSTTIDQRVVEMRFDNKQFESNVSTTMSTLDKLKQRLNLTGATKGLEDIGSAAKNVNMSGISTAVESVSAKFSAMQVVGVTALANITNSAVNAGKKIVSALTIDPIKTGFQEYETQINAVQTILANTSAKGTNINDVNKALEELNAYADKTIYNFTEMTRNIGTFTAAGIDLETSVSAIQGIANLAAVSGSTSQQASTAMYQLSQALAAGKVQLMDWNSVVNAGMGGEVFQNALIRTAAALDGSAESIEAWRATNIDNYGSFRESLTKGAWLTTDVLTKTLEQFTMSAKEGSKEWNEYKKTLMDDGYTEKQAEEILKMANTATDAATKVKTFTQLWDVLKESAQSGWSQTWKLILGDFEEAKALFTPLADTLTGFIGKMSDARNNLVEGVLDFATPWTSIMDKLDKAGLGKIKDIASSVDQVTGKLEHFQEVVDKVWRGDYKNSDTGRYDLLENAGYDHRVVQDLVNMGYQYELTIEDVEASHKKFGLTMDATSSSANKAKDALSGLSDEQLRNAGLTEDEISIFRALQKEADRTGKSISDLAEEMSNKDGRTMLIDSFKNIGSAVLDLAGIVKQAWVDIFPPTSLGDRVVQLYNILDAFKNFTSSLRLVDAETGKLTDTGDKLRRTLEGVFAIVDIVTTVVGGAAKIAFKTLTTLLGYFDLDILTVTANIGDAIVKFRDWMDSILDVSKAVEAIVPFVKKAKDAIKDWIEGLKETDNIPKYIIQGLVNGLKAGVGAVWNAAKEIGKSVLESVKEFLGIHSPSKKFIEVGQDVIAGLIQGLQNGASKVWDVVKNIALKIVDVVKNIDFGKLFAAGLGVGMLIVAKKLVDIVGAIAAPLEGLGEMLEGIGESFQANAIKKKAQAFLMVAVAIGIMAAAVAVLSQIDAGSLWNAVGVLAVLGVIVTAITVVLNKFTAFENMKSAAVAVVVLAISASLLLMAIALNKLASINMDGVPAALGLLAGVVVSVTAVCLTISKLAKGHVSKNIDKVGTMLTKMAVAMLLMVAVIKIASGMDGGSVAKGLAVVAAIETLFIAVIAVSKLAGANASSAGGMILKMSIAMLAMVAVIKLASMLDKHEIKNGLAAIAGIGTLFAALIAVSALAGKNASKAGTMLLLMSGAFLIITIVLKQISEMDDSAVERGMGVITGISLLFTALIAVSRIAGDNAIKAGTMLLLMSGALLLLTGVIFIITKLDSSKLGQALGVVAVLEILFGGLIAVTSLIKEDSKASLITLTVAVGLLVAAVIALTFLKPEDLKAATTALSTIITAFGLLVAATSLIKNPTSMVKNMAPLLLVVAGLAGILIAMAALKVEASLNSALAIGVLLTAMAASMAILNICGKTSAASVGALALMGVVVLELAVILGALSALNIEASMNSALALSVLLGAMAASMALLGLCHPSAAAVGALALMGLVVGELAIILGLMAHLDINPSIETAGALSILLVSMSAALLLLTAVGAAGPAALMGIGSLAVLIAGIGGLIVGIGALMDQFPALEEFLNKGIPIIEKIGYAIGSFFGNIVGGLLGGMTSGIPKMGEDLSAFMTNLQPFIDGAKSIDSSVTDGIKALASAFLMIVDANTMEGLTSWITGGSSLEAFGQQLPALATSLNEFATNLGSFDESKVSTVTCAVNAIKALASAADTIPNEGGWLGAIVGDNNILTFSGYLPQLALNLNLFAANLGTFDDAKVSTINCAVEAIKSLASVADSIPNEGGWLGAIVGDNNILTFSGQLPQLALNLNLFATNLGTFDEAKVNTVTCAAKAIKVLAEAANNIPNEGGWLAAIVGDNSISTFGAQLVSLGSNLNAFATNLGTFDEAKVATVNCAANAIKVLAQAASTIDGQSDWAKKLFGDNSLSAFGTEIASLGTNLKTFAANLGTFGEDKVATVKCAVSAVTAFSKLADTDLKGAAKNLPDFGDNIGKFAKDIKAFCDGMPESASITTAIANVNKVVTLIKDVANVKGDTLSKFTKSLKDLGKDGVNSFVEAFTSSTSLSTIETAATNLVKKAITSVEAQTSSLSNAFKKLVAEAVKGVKAESTTLSDAFKSFTQTGVKSVLNKYSNFYAAGMHLVEGFAAGISINTFMAEAKAAAMAEAALQAAKSALAINSPSKVFKEIGASVPEGFAMGIEQFTGMVSSSAVAMTDTAVDSVSESLHRIARAVDSDMDVQPTIKPILDLSNIKSGVGGISDMLNFGAPVRLGASIDSINSAMSHRIQNGANDDVVSAIAKLGKKLENVGNTYNSIGSVSANDNDVSDAIRTIVRAAKVERRT